MKIHTLFLFSVAMLLCVGVFGQDSVRISDSPVQVPFWGNGFRVGVASQAQLALPATLSNDDPYVISQPGFGGENGIELSYHFGYFGLSLGLDFGTFRVFNFKPHFDNAPGADPTDPEFLFLNQFHHYSMVHNLFLPLKLEFHYPFNPKFAIMADAGVKFAVGYQMTRSDTEYWISTDENVAMAPLYASLVADLGFYYRLPYGDLLRFAAGANVGFQHVTEGEYYYRNPTCNVQGEGTFFSRNTNFNLQIAYIHTFQRYKLRRSSETWYSELPRHEFQFNVGDPVLAVGLSRIGNANFFDGLFWNTMFQKPPTYWTQPLGDYPVTRFVPTFSFNYHYRVTKWFWVGGLATVAGLHNTWRDRLTDKVTGHGSEVCFTWMPDIRFSYLNRKHVTLYSGLGIGLIMDCLKDPPQFGEKALKTVNIGYQLTAFGVKAGAKHWFGDLELGMGFKGFLSAGFGYEF